MSCFSLPELLILPQLAVPAFPGATRTCWMRGDWASFQASACSRPPPPTTNTFTTIVPEEMKNVSTLVTAFTSPVKHRFNCMCMLTYSKRPSWAAKKRWPLLAANFAMSVEYRAIQAEKKLSVVFKWRGRLDQTNYLSWLSLAEVFLLWLCVSKIRQGCHRLTLIKSQYSNWFCC